MLLNPSSMFEHTLDEHIALVRLLSSQSSTFERIAETMAGSIIQGKKVLWCGNGGSAADSQHFAAELLGRFRRERRGLPSIALTTDTSAMTAIANDYGYERVFERQVEALCNAGDVVVGISTSGNSKNVCLALEKARQIGAATIALTGAGGGGMAKIADFSLQVPSQETARIQECHLLCGHMLCEWIEHCVCMHEQTAT